MLICRQSTLRALGCPTARKSESCLFRTGISTEDTRTHPHIHPHTPPEERSPWSVLFFFFLKRSLRGRYEKMDLSFLFPICIKNVCVCVCVCVCSVLQENSLWFNTTLGSEHLLHMQSPLCVCVCVCVCVCLCVLALLYAC